MIRAGIVGYVSELIAAAELSLPMYAEFTSEQIPPKALASRECVGAC